MLGEGPKAPSASAPALHTLNVPTVYCFDPFWIGGGESKTAQGARGFLELEGPTYGEAP